METRSRRTGELVVAGGGAGSLENATGNDELRVSYVPEVEHAASAIFH